MSIDFIVESYYNFMLTGKEANVILISEEDEYFPIQKTTVSELNSISKKSKNIRICGIRAVFASIPQGTIEIY